MRYRTSRSRINRYEIGIDEVPKVGILYSQCGTQEALKVGPKCFERGLEKF